jgi:hypothetical protein
VGCALGDSKHQQSNGDEEQDEPDHRNPWRPFAFAGALELVKVLRFLRG